MNNSKTRSGEQGRIFVSGVLVLSVSTMLIKILGLAYKIPMLSILGAEGMGYFNSAYEIYALLCIAATTGLPVAISMLVSSERAAGRICGVRKIFNSAMSMALTIGCIGSVALVMFSNEIASLIGNAGASQCIVSIAPALVFSCVSGVFRGYFQGLNKMAPTAVSQLIEVIGKLVFGIAFARFGSANGYKITLSASLAGWGLTLGMAISVLYLIICKRLDNTRKSDGLEESLSQTPNSYFKILITLAVPITLSSAITGIMRIMDMTMILKRLGDIGIDASKANEIYGAYTTMALPVFGLIPSLITPVSMALIPGISAAIGKDNKEQQSEFANNAIRITLLLALPSSLGIAVFALQILNMLFAGQGENAALVAPLLSVLGASVLFSCLITTTNAILHSYRKTKIPIFAMAAGGTVKLISEYLLIGSQNIGMLGAPISTLLCELTAALINLIFVIKAIPDVKRTVNSLWRIFLASVMSVALSAAVFEWSGRFVENVYMSMFFTVFSACFVYVVMIFILKAVSLKDIELIPFGEKITNALRSGIKKYIKRRMKNDS